MAGQARRRRIRIGGFKHANPIRNACRIGHLVMSGVILGRDPDSGSMPASLEAQFHVLGPLEKYPVRPSAAYQMPTATSEAAPRMHKALGIERGVIVQTTTYGADHAVMLGRPCRHGAELSRPPGTM